MNHTRLFNKRSQEIKPSEIGEILAKTRGQHFISFAAGVPDANYFPIKELADCAQRVIATRGKEVLQYGNPQGDIQLREALRQVMATTYNVSFSAEDIFLTTGSMQGLELCARTFLDVGDTLLVENPTFIDAMNTATFCDATVRGISCDDAGMNLQELKTILDTDPSVKLIYVIPDFQNPTGNCWTVERRKEFMELVSNYNVIILEDNPYGQIKYTDQINTALAAFDTKGQVIFLGSLSKTLSPGIRIGWVAAHPDVIKQYVMVKERCDLHSSIPDQAIVGEFMTSGVYESHVEFLCIMYKKRLDVLVDAIHSYLPMCKCIVPTGGFFLWVELPQHVDAMKLLHIAMREKVVFVPGEAFFVENKKANYMRINFTGIKEEDIVEGVKRISIAYNKL